MSKEKEFQSFENLENSRGENDIVREAHTSFYYNALDKALKHHDENDGHEYQEVLDENILEEIDETVGDILEEVRPDLIVKRISGLYFLVIRRDEYEKAKEEMEE